MPPEARGREQQAQARGAGRQQFQEPRRRVPQDSAIHGFLDSQESVATPHEMTMMSPRPPPCYMSHSTYRALSPVHTTKSISSAHSFLSQSNTRSTRSSDESQSLEVSSTRKEVTRDLWRSPACREQTLTRARRAPRHPVHGPAGAAQHTRTHLTGSPHRPAPPLNSSSSPSSSESVRRLPRARLSFFFFSFLWHAESNEPPLT